MPTPWPTPEKLARSLSAIYHIPEADAIAALSELTHQQAYALARNSSAVWFWMEGLHYRGGRYIEQILEQAPGFVDAIHQARQQRQDLANLRGNFCSRCVYWYGRFKLCTVVPFAVGPECVEFSELAPEPNSVTERPSGLSLHHRLNPSQGIGPS